MTNRLFRVILIKVMTQLFLPCEEQPNIKKTCVFTGHRELGEDFSPRKLKKEIKKLILEGVDTFLSGMAMGFDLIAAETVLSLKKKFTNVKLVACIPCYNQEKYFPEKDKTRYVKILKKADESVLLSDFYFKGCMQKRDKYMVERADVMITYCKKNLGGTAFTVKTFKKLKPFSQIVYL